MPMSSLFVPTAETSSLRFFLDLMVGLKKPIMFVGGAGVGMCECLCSEIFVFVLHVCLVALPKLWHQTMCYHGILYVVMRHTHAMSMQQHTIKSECLFIALPYQLAALSTCLLALCRQDPVGQGQAGTAA